MQPFPRQEWVTIGRSECGQQPIGGVTVHSHCLDNFEDILQGEGLDALLDCEKKNNNSVSKHPVSKNKNSNIATVNYKGRRQWVAT